MQTARRLYVYLIAGVSLGVLVAGIGSLLAIGLEELGLPGSGLGREAVGERMTFAAALIAVALPVWGIHWFLAERSVRPDRAEAAVERNAALRGLYMALALGGLLLAAASGAATAIRGVVHQVLGTELVAEDVAQGVAQLAVAGAAWAYHVWVRERDWRRGPLTGGAAWLPRTYLYVAAFAGVVALLVGIGGLLDAAWTSFVAAPSSAPDPYALGSELGTALVGGVVWLGHARYAERIVRVPGWRGDSERPARLRQGYFVAVVVAALGFTMLGLGTAAREAIRWAADLRLDPSDPAGAVVVPLLSAIPAAIVTWLHAGAPMAEARASGSRERTETAARLGLYPVALVGLGFAAVGLARFGGHLVNGLFGTAPFGGERWLIEAVAADLPFLVVGLLVWWWAWRGVGARVAADPTGEAASTIRRASLLIALAASVLAGIGAAAVVLYRLFGGLFGIDQPGDAVAEVSLPLATLAVAVAVGAYHGLLLRTDQSRLAVEPVAPAAAPRSSVAVRISGPPGSDALATLDGVRGGLPAGFELEVIDEPVPD